MKLKNHYIELLVCVSDKLGQLVQRCVIVQKDEKGYGLTVSGDNPVFVQSVKDSMYCVCVCVWGGEWGVGDVFDYPCRRGYRQAGEWEWIDMYM